MVRKRAKRLAGAVLAAGVICLLSRKMGDTPRQ